MDSDIEGGLIDDSYRVGSMVGDRVAVVMDSVRMATGVGGRS